MSSSFTITPRGPFSLAEAATFGFGQRDGAVWDEVMRLAFCLDGYQHQVVVKREHPGDLPRRRTRPGHRRAAVGGTGLAPAVVLLPV